MIHPYWEAGGHYPLSESPKHCGEVAEGFKIIALVTAIVALALAVFYFLATPAHADDGGVIGAVISAMSPTSTSPDSNSHGDDSDDD